ncbi:MAG: site-specific integrase [Clostridia bacterium]|nr:site-specific integrase [Clostridia bacterium]
MTVTDWLTDWLVLRSAELKPRTQEQYADLIRRFIVPAIGTIEAEDLRPDHLRHMLAQICASGHTRTAELVYVLCRCAFADLDNLDFRKIRRPAHKQTSPAAWSDADMLTYMGALKDHPHGLALALGLLCGLRRGEICGLRWRDIDFDAEEIHITNQRLRLASGEIVDAPPKSETSARIIPAPAPLLSQLRASRGLPSAYVCSLTPSGLDSTHRRLVLALGLPYIPLHGLRHSFATSCIRHGGEMRALQSVLGHASYSTTADRYTHPDMGMLHCAVDAAASFCYTVIHG